MCNLIEEAATAHHFGGPLVYRIGIPSLRSMYSLWYFGFLGGRPMGFLRWTRVSFLISRWWPQGADSWYTGRLGLLRSFLASSWVVICFRSASGSWFLGVVGVVVHGSEFSYAVDADGAEVGDVGLEVLAVFVDVLGHAVWA